jgi:ABC-type antimicrobial peptide transport system permease subunit
VNETFAKRFFPNGNALGHHVTSDSAAREIVGVVGDIVSGDLRGDPKPRFYYPMMQNPEPPSNFYLQIRTSRDPSAMISVVRKALLAPNPQLNIRSIDPLDVLIRDSVRQDRLVAQVVTMFGVLALGLAALGLYGVTAYATLRRRNEFGLRLALGALPGSIILMVLREALSMTVAGLLVGLPLAYFMMQLLRGQLYGVGALDVPSIAVSVVVLALTATVAACVPALRASRVAPLDALRAD